MRKRTKFLAFVLATIMMITSIPVSAAPGNYNPQPGHSFFQNVWENFWDKMFGKEEPENSGKDEETKENELTLIEDWTTVENGSMLRATTYETEANETVDSEMTTGSTTVKYFPVTMYDYVKETINTATEKLEENSDFHKGLYFSNGSELTSRVNYNYTTVSDIVDEEGNVIVETGEYILSVVNPNNTNSFYYVNNTVNNNSDWGTVVLTGTTDIESATLWKFTRKENGTYTIQDSTGKYLTITGKNAATVRGQENELTLVVSENDQNSLVICDNDFYLNALGKQAYFGGWTSGSSFQLQKRETQIIGGYAEWNYWNKGTGENANGDLFYTGLVNNTLVDDQIVFNVNEGGIFNDDSNVKSIYEYVGLPFVLDDNGYYTFDSDKNGAYFADTNGDGKSDPKSGTKESTYNLQFDQGNPQPLKIEVGDESKNAWFPYNIYQSDAYTETINYHFGMRADLPFSMTSNGRVKSTDDESEPIKFSFSGDDDFWVYVDGNLVIDLGGIHNRLDVTINFSENTVTYSEHNKQDENTETGSFNDPVFSTTQKLFTDNDGKGLIDMTRDAFAVKGNHEMSIFYLERGEGTSNCKIQFNLPMQDSVLITKDATKSWNSNNVEQDDEGVDSLTKAEQAIVDKLDFGFTLYKKEADDQADTFTAVTNTNFYILDAETGEILQTSNTDSKGHFYLKNGQTAKFITEIPKTGVTYYVVEDEVPNGFVTPDFNYAGNAVGGYDYQANKEKTHVSEGKDIPEQIIEIGAEINKSYEVTVYGSIEASDSVEFICTNYLNADRPNPSVDVMEDMIVIDYGLPVQIDPLANDIFRGDSIEIVYIGKEEVILTETEDSKITWTEQGSEEEFDFGKIEFNDVSYAVSDDGDVTRDTLIYTLTKPLTEVEIINYVVKVTGSKVQEGTGLDQEESTYGSGKIYIIPATSMYYEENFSDMVSFEGTGWGEIKSNASYVSEYQEPGVVGTVGDSTYGSDLAYLEDSEDSNGTSKFGDTTSKAIRFSYTFTGTGTSIFARTSAKTGYMQVKLYEGESASGSYIKIGYRDTYYCDKNDTDEDQTGTLYNIPVYTYSDLPYGTYTMVVTIAKAGTKAAGGESGSGNEFYLDGIRVMEPLNRENDTVINAATGETITNKALNAYAMDGEADMEVITLRKKLITDEELGTTPWNFVVLTDTDGTIQTAENYISIGPKEEVYLKQGQSVSFALKYKPGENLKVYMGMKAPFGSATAIVGKNSYNLKNATDCYYDITGNTESLVTKYEQAKDEEGNLLYTDADGNEIYEDQTDGEYKYKDNNVSITEETELTPKDDTSKPYYLATYKFTATDKIVSLTNIKVTGTHEFALVEDVDIDIDGGEIEEEENGGE